LRRIDRRLLPGGEHDQMFEGFGGEDQTKTI